MEIKAQKPSVLNGNILLDERKKNNLLYMNKDSASTFLFPLQSLHPSIQVIGARLVHGVSPDPAAENVGLSGPGPNRPDEFSHENRSDGEERGIDGEENRADCDG